MNSLPFRSALITGASAGIGRQYALELAARGVSRLQLLARRTERLEALAAEIRRIRGDEVAVEVITCDLLEAEQRERALAACLAQHGAPDLLVNNAGFGAVGRLADIPWPRQQDMVLLNCAALAHFAHGALQQMVQRGSGTIINVASTAAFQPLPYMTTYGATKAFVLSFSLGLYAEYRKLGVHVMAHCPGPTESEFHAAAGLTQKIDLLMPMPTAPVVAAALDAAAARRPLLVNGLQNKLMAVLSRFLPQPIVARFIAYKLGPFRGAGKPRAAAD